jgi:hypothetical protein
VNFPSRKDLDKYQEREFIEREGFWDYRNGLRVTVKNHKGEVLYTGEEWPGEPEDNCFGRDLDSVMGFGETVMYYSLKAWFEENNSKD